MFLDLYQHLPIFIDPIAFSIGSFNVRWYSISYLLSFFSAFLVLSYMVKNSEFKKDAQISNFKFQILNKSFELQTSYLVIDFLLVVFFSALIGGRIGYVLFYDFPYFISNLFLIISPIQDGKLVGMYGMSYHGALLAILLASVIFLRIKKINFWAWADITVLAVALGYFFGRLGNFLNGELYGRVTNSKLGMYFLADPKNLRHPSQLYEAFLEGLILFVFLWWLRRFKFPRGALFCIYLIGYGLARIIAEFFRQPDPQIGFIIGFFTLGQLLSFLMIMIGGVLLIKITRQVEPV